MPHADNSTPEWATLLADLRADFDAMRRGEYPIRSRLIHKATNAECYGVRGFPHDTGASLVGLRDAGRREPVRHLDENGRPRFLDTPVLDVNGNPIEDAERRAYDVTMPVFRSVYLYGDGRAANELMTLADRGGRIAKGVPVDLYRSLTGWTFSDPESLWWALLFELSWSGRWPTLSAKRQLWIDGTFVPYDAQELRFLAETGMPLGIIVPAIWCVKLPDAFTCEIKSTVTACRDLCDYLARHQLAAGQGDGNKGKAGHGASTTKRPKRKRTRERRTVPTERELRVVELKSRGFTYSQIAEELGISTGRVGQLLRSYRDRTKTAARSVNLTKAVSLNANDQPVTSITSVEPSA